MSDKHRALPSWMAKKQEVKEKEPLKSRRKRKVARGTFYCMNEKELVEAAVSFLTHGAAGEDVALLTDQKTEFWDKAEDTTAKIKEKPASSKAKPKAVREAVEEESSDCSEAQEATYISETDLDVTEVETLPYTNSQRFQEPEAQRSGPVQNHSGAVISEPEADKKEERSQTITDAKEEEEDDALRLVREIFFT